MCCLLCLVPASSYLDARHLRPCVSLIPGSTTDLASVVEMFDNLLERSRRGGAADAEASPPESPDSADSPADSPVDSPVDALDAPTAASVPMRPLQIVEERDEPAPSEQQRKRDVRGGRYTKRRAAEPRPLSVSSTSSSSSSACSSLPRGRVWRLQPTESAAEPGRSEGLHKSASSGERRGQQRLVRAVVTGRREREIHFWRSGH